LAIVAVIFSPKPAIIKSIAVVIIMTENQVIGKKDLTYRQYNKPELNELLTDLDIDVIKCNTNHPIALIKSGDIYVWGWMESDNLCR
jgi:alpha-tubulin suppressor-like RCC1 family protein